MEKVIGLSLSVCIRDIARGIVDVKDVSYIITSTNLNGDMDQAYKIYSESYWRDVKDAAYEALSILRQEGKIFEPRTKGLPYPNISDGHWIPSDSKEYTADGISVDDNKVQIRDVLKAYER